MPLLIERNDITKIRCDAIVNAANSTLLGGGGVDGAIHNAAGEELLKECRTLGGCKTGEAKITKGYFLPSRYVIHTVGPIWQGGNSNEDSLLYLCYENSLIVAKEYELNSVAFPLISAGAYGFPKERALKIAVRAITDFLFENDMDIIIVVYDKSSFSIGKKLMSDITEYIDDCYVDANYIERSTVLMPLGHKYSKPPDYEEPVMASIAPSELSDAISKIDESFSQMLLRKIDESGMKDSECYKKANIDRKLFSKIRSDVNYRPSKQTAVAFAIALKMNIFDARELISKAGYSLSHSSKFDIIIEFFILHNNYDINEINEALFSFDQVLLGV